MYHILLPVDREEERTQAQADYVLDLPIDPEDLEVTILFVLSRPDAEITDESGFEGNEGAVTAANRLEGTGITVNRTVIGAASVSQQIIKTARAEDVDQIVVAGRKRTGVTRVLIGSTASDIIQAADRPVVMTG